MSYPSYTDISISAGCLLLFLLPYSLDLNPIEESFSTCMFIHFFACIAFLIHEFYSQSLMHHHGAEMRAAEDPVQFLLEACGCIMGEMACRWFHYAGYL